MALMSTTIVAIMATRMVGKRLMAIGTVAFMATVMVRKQYPLRVRGMCYPLHARACARVRLPLLAIASIAYPGGVCLIPCVVGL